MPSIKNISIVIFAACALLSTEAFASAGHVIYSFGHNYVLNKAGKKHTINKGDEVFSGDTLITSQHGRVQLRFSDKGMVSIMPDSEYKIDDYEFVPGDDNKQRGFFSLLRGGARQITGLLSKIRHERFRFRTTVATIGIRGTGFYVRLCKASCYDGNGKLLPDGMYVKNNTGIITMSNDGGEIELAQGQSAFSANNKDKPRQIYEPPAPYNVAFNDVDTFDFNISKTLDSGIVQVTGGPTPPPLALTRLESSFILPGGSKVEQHNADTGVAGNTITHNASSITAYNGVVSGPVAAPTPAAFDSTGGTLVESGSNTTLGVIWSRWTGGFSVTENGSPVSTADNNIHMIGAASLTPATGIPSTGILSYTSIAGTSPTFVGPSSTAVGTQSITFDINYQTQELSNMSVTANFAGGAITASQTNGIDIISGSSSVINLSGTCDTVNLCNQTGSGVMSGQISVNLVGANAQGAFGTYGLSNNFDASVTGSYLATGK